MKVVAFNGSPNKAGNTYNAIKNCSNRIRKRRNRSRNCSCRK
ncbi:hypothetical protein [Terrisporobacter mayombei]|uniref:NADPH-dependent FMN reductase-like domain-containing protein n=1 Tax=Terrisporobacter mayombei TaxID=1541 RepID=A0ABY9PYF4_9FIRM|nr:hypothetical protein TEMA_04130 [Terrisporobacter mayombei]